MPLKYFQCPTGERIPTDECLVQCQQPEGRCASLPYLHHIVSHQRPWTGVPSTTQCLNGTRMEYLKITMDYTLDPDDQAYAVLGTRHHERLQIVADKLGMNAEMKLYGEVSGILDLLEPDEQQPDFFKLIDYKTWGSYKIAKAKGMKGEDIDIDQVTLQLNHYRVKVEPLGFPISRIQVQATCRDGNTQNARDNEIRRNIHMIDIPLLEDGYVTSYFHARAEALVKAVETHTLPKACSTSETWGGRRCKNYCEVVEFCPDGRKMAR